MICIVVLISIELRKNKTFILKQDTHFTILIYYYDYLYEKHGKSERNYFLPGGRLTADEVSKLI